MPKKSEKAPKQSASSQEEKVRDYIVKERSRGFELAAIRKKLVTAGYSDEDIDHAVQKYHLGVDSSEMAKVSHEDHVANLTKILEAKSWKYTAAVIVAVVAMVIIGYLLIGGTVDCGVDEDCFISHANVCEPAVLTQDVQGTLFNYDSKMGSQVTSDCRLLKKVDGLDPREPQEIKDIFEGASMECKYLKGQFNPDLVRTITKGLEQCDGTLKTAIYEMVLAIYELQEEGKI